MQTLIYLHGFRSASQSKKATQLDAALHHVQADWEYVTPNLSFDPSIAIQQVETIIARSGDAARNIVLIGSSLGGFYAAVLAEKFSCRAVLLNPSLAPFETLANYLGEQTNLYTGEVFTFTDAHINVLRSFSPTISDMTRYLLIVEMGDELLDHQKTLAAFPGAKAISVVGGNHNLDSFPQHISAVLHFANAIKSARDQSAPATPRIILPFPLRRVTLTG
jgi:uncharacterized protein